MLARRSMLLGVLAAAVTAAAPAEADVYVRIGPPAPRFERIPPPPHGPHRWVWVPGYWRWDGYRYFWFGGRYVRHGGYWRSGYWVHRPRGWIWIDGGWH
jgi:hypothetical protein